jgi:hypothetical protein
VLQDVHRVVPDTVGIHLFGIARMGGFEQFAGLGVRSVDSASYLRRAWMGSGGENYLTDEGFYTAIRIPEAGKSFRAKRMVSEGRVDGRAVMQLEWDCLRAMADFDAGVLGVGPVLDVLLEYDQHISPDRTAIRSRIERTL